MTTIEISLSNNELKKIKYKHLRSIFLNILLILITGVPLYIVNQDGIRFDWSILLFNIIFLIFFILFLLNLSTKIFRNNF